MSTEVVYRMCANLILSTGRHLREPQATIRLLIKRWSCSITLFLWAERRF
jgi:hypothetical protein